MDLDKKIEHFSHHHPLILKEEKQIDETITFKCSGCRFSITDGPIYVCDQCQEFVLHKSCVELPKEIQHPFHPHHPLVLLSKSPYETFPFTVPGDYYCGACNCRGSGFVFHCAECQFDLDVTCASLEPTISYECHDHLLTPFDTIGFTVDHLCVLCGQNIYGEIVLRCVACKFNVHKSCADLFPKQIQHPFHPDHPLTLKTHLQGAFTCHACKGRGNRCSFSCDECHFILHIECARLLPNIKCQGHEHLLTLIKKTYQHTLVCNLCGLSCDVLVLACVQCDFYIHVHCNHSIPRTIKHECHIDTLTLVDSLVEKQYRGDSNEFYCDACEKLRNPNEPAYYCAECQFMAEIRCVISEVLSPLTVKQANVLPEANFMDSTSSGDEDDELKTRADETVYREDPIVLELEEEMEKLNLEERTITTQLESLALRLESLTSQSEVLSPLTVKQASVLPEANFMGSTSNGDEDDERKTRADEVMYREDPIVLELEEEMEKLKLEKRTITTQLESLTLRLDSLTSQSEVLKAKVDDNKIRICESRQPLKMLGMIFYLDDMVSDLVKNKRLLEALQFSKK